LMRGLGRWLGRDIIETAINMPPEHRYEILRVFSPDLNIDIARKNIEDLWYYFRLEEYEIGLRWLRQRLGLELPHLHYRDRHDETRIVSLVDNELTPKVLTQLTRIFEPEYQLLESFGYTRPQYYDGQRRFFYY